MKSIIRRSLYELVLRGVMAMGPRAESRFEMGVLKVDKLGDAVLSLGAIRRLLQDNDESRLLLVVSDLAAPLFRAEFPAATILGVPPFCYTFAPDYLRFLRWRAHELMRVQVDRLVCLRHQPSDYLTTIARLLRAKETITAPMDVRWEKSDLVLPGAKLVRYPGRTGYSLPDGVCSEIEAHRRVVEAVVGKPLPVADVLPEIICASPVDGDALILCPEAGISVRNYPLGKWVEVMGLLEKEWQLPLEICLPPTVEKAPLEAMLDAAGIQVRQWHYPGDVVELCRVLAGAKLIFANETGPAHLATAMNKRGVFVLGGGDYGMCAPWSRSSRQRWISHPVGCYYCHWNCIHSEPICITQIHPGQIATAVKEVMTVS